MQRQDHGPLVFGATWLILSTVFAVLLYSFDSYHEEGPVVAAIFAIFGGVGRALIPAVIAWAIADGVRLARR